MNKLIKNKIKEFEELYVSKDYGGIINAPWISKRGKVPPVQSWLQEALTQAMAEAKREGWNEGYAMGKAGDASNKEQKDLDDAWDEAFENSQLK